MIAAGGPAAWTLTRVLSPRPRVRLSDVDERGFISHVFASGAAPATVETADPGDYELGMLDGEDGFAAVRREKRTDGDGEEQWETLFVSGDDAAQRLPSLAHVAPLEGETKIVLEGRTWRVIEAS